MKSMGTEPKPNSAPIIRLDEGPRLRIAAVAAASQRFLMWDLPEEFVTAGIWPLARGWSFLVALPLANRELVTTEDDDKTTSGRRASYGPYWVSFLLGVLLSPEGRS